MNELVTAIRSIVQLKVMFIYGSGNPPAIAMRGTRAELAMTQWLFRGLLDKPGPGEYSAGGSDFVRLFYLKNTQSVPEMQELATLIRSMVEARQMFTYNPSKVLLMRGAPADLDFAQWLIAGLDKRSPLVLQSPEYRTSSDDMTRVFVVEPGMAAPGLQKLATQIRSATEVTRIFASSAKSAIVVRGTPAQIRKAQVMIEAQDKAHSTTLQ